MWGDTVNVASRLEETGIPGKVHVSEVTKMMVTNGFAFEPCEAVNRQGVGLVNTYFVSPHPVAVANKTGLPVSE